MVSISDSRPATEKNKQKSEKRKMLKKWFILILLCFWCGCNSLEAAADMPEPTATTVPTLTNTVTPANTPQPTLTNTPVPTSTPQPTPTNTPTPTCTPTPKPSVTISMVGDILLHTRIHDYSRQEDGSYNYDEIFTHLKDKISAADLALVNQEVVLGGTELGISGYPSFNAPQEAGDALVNAGFDVVLHATNHALDKKKRGIQNTLEFWEENYPEIGVLGIHDSAEDQQELYVVEIEGIRIAILNYTYGTNGIALPSDMPYAVDLLEEEKVIENLIQAGEMADFVIVCPHWGTEYRLTPDKSQKKWAELFLEYGADLVLGTHPHVIEPVEWLTNEETGEQMLVYYSIGNFVNWTSGTGEGVANRMVGGMANVTIELDEAGKAYIAEYGVEAVVCHVENKPDGITVYALSEYTEEMAEQNAICRQDSSFSLEYCVDLCNQVWEDLWK